MKKLTKKTLLDNAVVIFFLLCIFFLPFFSKVIDGIGYVATATFIINGLFFIIGIYLSKRWHTLSMELIFWLFMFFFMYFAPLIQYRMKLYPWNTSVSDTEVIFANALIFIFSIFVCLGVIVARKTRTKGLPNLGFFEWLCSDFEFKKNARIFLTLLSVLLALFSLSRTGISGIVVSRAHAIQVFYSGSSSAVELIVEAVIPSFMAYITAESAHNMIEKKENGLRFLILFICLLICFFPTAIPRYKAATIYGVVFIMLCPWITKNSRFFWLFTGGLFLIFPALDAFRNILSFESIKFAVNQNFFESYTDGNYDAWRMLISSIRHNLEYGSTLGKQLLGVIFFFIPSSIWSSKPIGSGAMLIKEELGANTFANVSCPFIAEGFVNFGIIGIVFFAITLGFVIGKLDKKYWTNFENNTAKGLFSPYLFLVFMLFFLLRGDLLSGFAYVCGFIATGFLLKIFTK